MNDGEIDDILQRAAKAQPEVDPALLERVSRLVGAAGASLAPVRPLPPAWLLAAASIALSAALAVAGALILGPAGVRQMNALQAGWIFPLLSALLWLAAALCVAEAIPGSRRPVAPWVLGTAACLLLAAVFGLVFPDHHTERFVPQGIRCLTAGLAQAVPASLGSWLILRRGFAVHPAASGFARGVLAGLAGVLMLELHCANFEAPHVIVWHIGVLPLAGLAGMALSRRRPAAPR